MNTYIQIFIYLYASIGCRSLGIELASPRHEAAQWLVETFIGVLEEVNLIVDEDHPSLLSLLELQEGNCFLPEGEKLVLLATHIFFDNFGLWFKDKMPQFNDMLLKSKKVNIYMCMYIQIFI